MMGKKSLGVGYDSLCIKAVVKTRQFFEKHANVSLFFLGIALLFSAGADVAQAGSGSYSQACNGVLSLVEGTFGAMVTAIAGIGAILAAAVGGFKMAWSLLVVAIGSFILRSFITLFNGDCGGG
jgi:hypothetical protein